MFKCRPPSQRKGAGTQPQAESTSMMSSSSEDQV
jgi:hypothetical protein